MERGVTKNEILTQLCRSPHSALNEYIAVGGRAAAEEPEFFSHLIAWDARKGQIRDAHIALPIIALGGCNEPEFIENALAHIAKLSPRELYTAMMFAKGYVRNKDVVQKVITGKDGKQRQVNSRAGGWKRFQSNLITASRRKRLDRLVSRYLSSRESNAAEFERNVVNFKRDIVSLYELSHTPMSDYAKIILIDKVAPLGSAIEAVRNLDRMSPLEAAAAIVEHRLPFRMLFPILKSKVKDPVLLMAIIDRMTPSELQTNMAMLEKFGVKEHAETRAALENALKRMASSRKTTLKTGKAVEAVQDQALKSKLAEVQEKQIGNLKGIEGNWLVLADKSGSMTAAIDAAREIVATLTRFVKGKVALCFFDTTPTWYDMTGKTLEQIQSITKYMRAMGGTSIGCGLAAAYDRRFDVEGIVVVSDGAEHSAPYFFGEYERLCKKLDRQIPVYFYKLDGEPDGLEYQMKSHGHDIQVFDLRYTRPDSYSMPNMVQTMRVNKYSVLDEIMDTRLLTVDEVLGIGKGVADAIA